LAPGVSDLAKVLLDNMRDPMEHLAKCTLTR